MHAESCSHSSDASLSPRHRLDAPSPTDPLDPRQSAPPILPKDANVAEALDYYLRMLYDPLVREARRLNEARPRTIEEAIADYLGCDIYDVRAYKVNALEADDIAYAAHKMLENPPAGWTIHARKVNQFHDALAEAVVYSEVEVGPNQRTYCFTGGHLFIESPDRRYVLTLTDPDYMGKRSMYIYLPDKSATVVREILDHFHSIRKTESRFKGKRFTVGDKEYHFLDVESIDWDDVFLEPDVVEELKRNVFIPIAEPQRWMAAGLPLRRSILLSGPPGTGKTLIGKLIASKTDNTFMWITADGLGLSSNVRSIYELARDNRPTVLFFEDLDIVASRHGSNSAVLGEILAQTDGLESNDQIITIATTNNPECLDEALQDRPGRFDRHIRIRPPEYDLRIAMLRYFSAQFHLVVEEATLRELTENSAGLTGAHLREIAMVTAMDALRDGWDPREDPALPRATSHFLAAVDRLKNVKPEIGFRK